MSTFHLTKYNVIALAFLMLLPSGAFAAEVYLYTDPAPVSVGSTITIHAMIDTEGQLINAVEGNIVVSGTTSPVQVNSIEDGDSVLTVWPQSPQLSDDDTHIAFIGGLPGGFTLSHAKLFDFTVTAKSIGDMTFTPVDIAAYLNDGKGTSVAISTANLTVHVNGRKSSLYKQLEYGALILMCAVLILGIAVLYKRKSHTYL